MFITFEGIDGSGKSTQLMMLATALENAGKNILRTRDPGGTSIGKALREILLHHPGYVAPRCELLLYLADRAQHVDEVIRPALSRGKIVLCDRYLDSTLAYQGGGRQLPLEDITMMNTWATQGLVPDVTFLFDAPVSLLLARAKNRSQFDRLEHETVEFYEAIRAQYLILAAQNPERFHLLNASESVDILSSKVFNVVNTLMG